MTLIDFEAKLFVAIACNVAQDGCEYVRHEPTKRDRAVFAWAESLGAYVNLGEAFLIASTSWSLPSDIEEATEACQHISPRLFMHVFVECASYIPTKQEIQS